ncbi:NADase-type glycan-binding domain-containing protein [Propionibacteriaceae bacterium Y2011]|uniref:discoidin domain-containing protein n=1 Tax=Microlunatus sp. Y2014 TaxID=3418488 RepID=UPI003B4E68CC
MPLPQPRPTLCPSCQYPLLLAAPDRTHRGMAGELQRPTNDKVDEEGTRLVPMVHVSPPPPVAPEVPTKPCPVCGWRNAVDRQRCERCASPTREVPVPTPPPPPPPPRQQQRGIAWWMIVLPALIVLLVITTIVLLVQVRPFSPPAGGGESATPPSAPASTPAEPSPTTLSGVDPSTITVTASSTLPPDPESYEAGNLLDGDPETAWNSNGSEADDNTGVTLTFTFAEPVRVGRIDLSNGFSKNDGVFERNCRVKTLTVETEGGATHTFEVKDTQDVQQLVFDFGAPTTKLTFTIDEVYDGSRYRDVAITEVVFHALS